MGCTRVQLTFHFEAWAQLGQFDFTFVSLVDMMPENGTSVFVRPSTRAVHLPKGDEIILIDERDRSMAILFGHGKEVLQYARRSLAQFRC